MILRAGVHAAEAQDVVGAGPKPITEALVARQYKGAPEGAGERNCIAQLCQVSHEC